MMSIFKLIKVCFLVGILIFTYACKNNSETGETFSIAGSIRNPQKGKVILTQLEDINRKQIKIIGEFSIDKKGKFSKSFNLEPHIYQIDFYGKEKITLAIDKGQKVEILADGNNLKAIEVKGSDDTKKLQEYEKMRKESLTRLVKSVRKEIKDLELQNKEDNKKKIEQLGVAEVENYEKHRTELNDYIKKNMGSSIAIYPTTLRWGGDENIELYKSIVKLFEQNHPNLAVTKRINEKLEVLENTSIGGQSSKIVMANKDGKEIELYDIKRKYVLVDFWASWCGPCRRESSKLSSLYEKYKAKGFDIYSVSLDTEKDRWLKAAEDDGRVWTNVSTLQGFETPATFDYAVTALPAKFIIDSDGKIVAKNLHGDELVEKLDSLFEE